MTLATARHGAHENVRRARRTCLAIGAGVHRAACCGVCDVAGRRRAPVRVSSVCVCVPCCVHRLVRVVALNSRFNAHPGSLTPKETRKATLYLSRMRLRACAGRRIIDCCMVRFAPLCALRLRSAGSPLWLTPSPVPPPCHRGALFASAGPLITTIPSRSRYMSARAAAELSLTSLAGRGACMRARRC